jgi:hypothetical protein
VIVPERGDPFALAANE